MDADRAPDVESQEQHAVPVSGEQQQLDQGAKSRLGEYWQAIDVNMSVAGSYNWNTRKAASGTHTIKATAWDAAGNSASTSISVTK